MPREQDTWYGVLPLDMLARTSVWVEEPEAAIDQLENLLSVPSWVSVPRLRLDPVWDPLRDHPRFQALLEKYHQPDN